MWRYHLGGLLVLGLIACSKPAQQEPSDDALVLELGGRHKPLGAQLDATGASRRPAPAPASSEAIGDPEVVAASERTVELRKGDTIMGLARTHLGSASRWREIVALNGWSEDQVRRLPVGTKVRLPGD